MAKKIKGIVQVGDPVLRQKAKPVLQIGKKEKNLAQKMKKLLLGSNGIGLAAPQVGVSQQIVVIGTDNKKWQKEIGIEWLALFNPEIVSYSSQKVVMQEGCLSFMDPEIVAEVERPLTVKVKALDEQGRKTIIKAEGLLARILQHEIDHLKGVLFTDRANPKTIKVVKEKTNKGEGISI